ncbi:MAG: hypothetical protein ACU0BK_10260 [Shimia sp.]
MKITHLNMDNRLRMFCHLIACDPTRAARVPDLLDAETSLSEAAR